MRRNGVPVSSCCSILAIATSVISASRGGGGKERRAFLLLLQQGHRSAAGNFNCNCLRCWSSCRRILICQHYPQFFHVYAWRNKWPAAHVHYDSREQAVIGKYQPFDPTSEDSCSSGADSHFVADIRYVCLSFHSRSIG